MTETTATRINRLAERLDKVAAPKRLGKKRAARYVKHSNAIDADTAVALTRVRSSAA
jgi:hypothetical protein